MPADVLYPYLLWAKRSSTSRSTIHAPQVPPPKPFFRGCLHKIVSCYRLRAGYSQRIGRNCLLIVYSIAVGNRCLLDTAASGRHEIELDVRSETGLLYSSLRRIARSELYPAKYPQPACLFLRVSVGQILHLSRGQIDRLVGRKFRLCWRLQLAGNVGHPGRHIATMLTSHRKNGQNLPRQICQTFLPRVEYNEC